MALLTTHHKPYFSSTASQDLDKTNSDISMLVTRITFDILRDCPGLVADVANGLAEREVLETAIIKDIDKHKYHFGLSRDNIIKDVFNYMFGYGPLQTYIEDEDISDIDGTKYNEFIVKRNGIKERIPVNFGSEDIFDTYCKLVTIRNNGILNENDSHCRFADEKNRLRINTSIRPRNVSGPAISIRHHRRNSYTLDDLVGLGMIDAKLAGFFRNVAKSSVRFIICGKGGAGKTTLLRTLINIFNIYDRLLIVEKDSELYTDKPCCITQRVKRANEGGRIWTLRNLVEDGLTMSLDGYIVGELISDEAWEFIKGANTDHRVAATTHADNTEDCLFRILTLCMSANIGESEKTIKEMTAKGIDLVVYMKGFRVVEVSEVAGYDSESDRFSLNRLYSFDIKSEDNNGLITGKFLKGNELGQRMKERMKLKA